MGDFGKLYENFILWLVIFGAISGAAAVGIIWVACHFISKFW